MSAPETRAEAYDLDTLLAHCLKPDEIAGPRQATRVRELILWFTRFTRGMANPKWFRAHAYELAYALAAPQPPTPAPGGATPDPRLGEIRARLVAVLSRPSADEDGTLPVKQYEADVAYLVDALEARDAAVACGVCLGRPLASGRECVCGGVGTEQAEMHGLRVECFRLREEAQARDAELAALREDAARLDWMQGHGTHHFYQAHGWSEKYGSHAGWYRRTGEPLESVPAESLRDAIDAARRAGEGV